MFTNIKDEYQILDDMMELTVVDTTKSVGGLLYDALAPCANQLAEQYMEIRSNLARSFVEYSDSEYLDMKAKEFGLERKDANKAVATVEFNGLKGTVIPVGFSVKSKSGLTYKTTEELTIGSSEVVVGTVEAENTGTAYNIAINQITEIPVTLTGLFTVNNIVEATGGSEIEEDDSLRERILDKMQNPAASGNANHYKLWAMTNAGVGDAKVHPIWNGPGTVKVTLVDTNKYPANAETVKEVYDYIESERPIGATVTVVPADKRYINISVTVVTNDGTDISAIQEKLEEKVISYLKDIAFTTNYVSIAKIGSLILSIDGVLDYDVLKLNDKPNNVSVAPTEVAIIGEVIVNG